MSTDNPMRDVIEQMKATAQREGKQQTTNQRRAIEHLTTAKLNATSAYNRLVDADLYVDGWQAPKAKALYEQAEQLQKRIEELLQEVQG